MKGSKCKFAKFKNMKFKKKMIFKSGWVFFFGGGVHLTIGSIFSLFAIAPMTFAIDPMYILYYLNFFYQV